MPTRKKTTTRRQIRRCALCDKIGHNRSTCPENIVEVKKIVKKAKVAKKDYTPQVKPALQFFVHHVNTEPTPSAHVIDLKRHNIWNDIETIAPANDKDNIYYYYHNHKTTTDKTNAISKPQINYHYELPPVSDLIPKLEKETFHKINFLEKKTVEIKRKKDKFVLPKIRMKEKIYDLRDNMTDASKNFSYHFRQWQKIYFPLRRTLVSLIIFSLIIFAPTHAKGYYQSLKLTAANISDSSLAGFDALQESTSLLLDGNIDNAQTSLAQSLKNFENATKEMTNNHYLLQKTLSYIPFLNKEIESRQNLVSVGYDVSIGNSYLLETLSKIQNSSSTITDNISLASKNLNLALPYYQQAQSKLNSTDKKILPEEYQADFEKFKKLFNSFTNDLKKLADSSQAIHNIFGGQGYRRYLVVFQNQNEIRPTGGFIGSFAILEVNDGKIVDMTIPAGGSYDLQGQLDQYVEPPAPLLTVVDRWHFRDANWFADFPASAEKLMWFYRHSRQVSTDGVIAINAEVLNRVLNITGPIKDEKRDVVLTANTAIDTIQYIVEKGEEKIQNKPKQVITDVAPKFIEYFKTVDSKNAMLLLANLQQALEQKEVQAYFVDRVPQKMVSDLGWDGKILPTKTGQDYLMVVNSNIGGQKSDAEITQEINHEAIIQSDGNIVVTVTIDRTHNGKDGENFYGFTNIDYLRLYVPKGSKLISAGGFTWLDEKSFKAPNKYTSDDQDLGRLVKEINFDPLTGTRVTEEFDKTAFANWVVTKPGQSSKIYFTYQLPFKAFNDDSNEKNKWTKIWEKEKNYSDYQLVLQKQSGINSKFESKIIYPNSWSPSWYSGEEIVLASNGLAVQNSELNKDKVWTILMNKK